MHTACLALWMCDASVSAMSTCWGVEMLVEIERSGSICEGTGEQV